MKYLLYFLEAISYLIGVVISLVAGFGVTGVMGEILASSWNTSSEAIHGAILIIIGFGFSGLAASELLGWIHRKFLGFHSSLAQR